MHHSRQNITRSLLKRINIGLEYILEKDSIQAATDYLDLIQPPPQIWPQCENSA